MHCLNLPPSLAPNRNWVINVCPVGNDSLLVNLGLELGKGEKNKPLPGICSTTCTKPTYQNTTSVIFITLLYSSKWLPRAFRVSWMTENMTGHKWVLLQGKELVPSSFWTWMAFKLHSLCVVFLFSLTLFSGLYCGIWLWCSAWWWVDHPSWGSHQECEKTWRRRMVRRGAKWQEGHVPWQFCEGEFFPIAFILLWSSSRQVVIDVVRICISCICKRTYFFFFD